MNPSALYLSIDDVVPIDPDKAGKSLADYLHTFGQITFFSLVGLAVLSLVVAIVVAKKAGYSGWWGAIAVLFPPVGLVLVLLLAMLKWPALKERDEALGILASNELTLPSHERKAIKEAERKLAIEDAARKRMEKAQADREKADAERARFAASEAKRAASAAALAAIAAPAATTGADAPAKTSVPAAPSETKVASETKTPSAPPAPPAPNAADRVADAPPAPSAPAAPTGPRTEAPGSVAPKVRTARPRTSTNSTTGAAGDKPKAPPAP